MLSVKEKFSKEIDGIFRNNVFRANPIVKFKKGFVSIDKIPASSILFIGINPSDTDEDVSDFDGVFYYNLLPDDNKYRKYFSKFEDISKKVGVAWGHMDLLYFRETEQSLIDKILQEESGVSFIWEQLQISKQILEESTPKILVVCNTKARQFLGKDKIEDGKTNVWLGYDFKFDDKIGTDRIVTQDSKLKGIPVFFTSMLTGQRALDNGSYERLKWHIKFALNGGVV